MTVINFGVLVSLIIIFEESELNKQFSYIQKVLFFTKIYFQMEELFNEMTRKSKTLSSWSREQVDAVNRLKNAWDRLQSLLENHQHIIAKQVSVFIIHFFNN